MLQVHCIRSSLDSPRYSPSDQIDMNPDLVTAGLGGKHIECEEGHCGGAAQPEGSEATLHRCRDQYFGMKSEVAKRLRQLEDENRRLKQLLVDLSLENRMLKYVTSKEY